MTDIAQLGVIVDPFGAVQGTGRVNKAFDSMIDRSRKLGTTADNAFALMRKGVLSLGAAFSAAKFGSDVFRTTREFEKAIDDLSAITGATGRDLDFLRKSAREFGAQTSLSASQAADAFKLIASAKPDLLENAAALKEVTKEALILAQAAGITLPEAANVLGISLNQFGASADQASRFINVLAAGAKFGASEIFETSIALRQSGVAAQTAKVSFEELNAAIQILAARGIKGAQAGTELRNVMLILATQQDERLNPAIVGFNKALENLGKFVNNSTDQLKLFGRENINAADTLVKNRDELQRLTERLTDTNTAYEQASVRTDNLDTDVKKLGSSYEELLLTIGDALLPAFRQLIQLVTSVIDVFSNAARHIDGFTRFTVGQFLIGVAEMRLGLVRVAAFMNRNFSDAIAFIINRVGDMAVAMGGFFSRFGILEDIKAMGGAMQDFGNSIQSAGGAASEAGWNAVIAETEEEVRRLQASFRETQDVMIEALFSPPVATAKGLEDLGNSSDEAGDKSDKASKKVKKLTDEQRKALEVFRNTRTAIERYTMGILELNSLLSSGLITQETYARAVAQLREEYNNSNEALRRGQQIFDETRNATERYTASILELNQLLNQGVISQDTYARAVAKLRDEYNKAAEAAKKNKEEVSDSFRTIESAVGQLGTQIEDVFVGMATGAKFSFEDMSKSVIESITRMVTRLLVVEPLVNNITKSLKESGLFGTDGGSGGGLGSLFGGGGGGFLSNLFGGLFGGGGGAPFGQQIPLTGPGLLQHGGPVTGGRPFIVGEAGPELFVPASAGQVVSNRDLQQIGRALTIVNNFTIEAPQGRVSRQTENQISMAALQGATRAIQRNG